jgi:hypothetical protein
MMHADVARPFVFEQWFQESNTHGISNTPDLHTDATVISRLSSKCFGDEDAVARNKHTTRFTSFNKTSLPETHNYGFR